MGVMLTPKFLSSDCQNISNKMAIPKLGSGAFGEKRVCVWGGGG